MRRREFMKLACGLGVGAAVAGACSPPAASHGQVATSTTGSSTTTSTTPVSPSSVPTTTTTTTRATGQDWRGLSSAMQGRLLRPSSPGYSAAVQSYNPVFDQAHPEAVAYCASPTDVGLAIEFAKSHGVELSLRSGGHSYGGWSTGPGLVVDVSPMNHVDYDPATGSVSVGSGTRLVDLYSALAPHGVAVPGGSCPSVGIAGLALGGGLGVLGRKFGLTCDNLEAAEVMLASGETVTCDSKNHADLFWALRGGGGGSFGVVTRFTFSTHRIASLGLFTLVWPWPSAAAVASAWQDWAPGGPDELWSNCLLVASQSTPTGEAPAARVTGVYVGPQTALEALVEGLVSEVGTSPFTNFVGSAGYLETMLIEAGCENYTIAECHLPRENPAGLLGRAPFVAKSNIVDSKLSAPAISTMLAAVEQRQASPVLAGGGFVLDAAGGAINRVAPDATAYVHRSSLATLQYSAGWDSSATPSVVASNRQWIETAWASMRPYVSSGAYLNYADLDLVDWQQAYWGANFTRLTEVKRAYDPQNLFHFPQSIPPA